MNERHPLNLCPKQATPCHVAARSCTLPTPTAFPNLNAPALTLPPSPQQAPYFVDARSTLAVVTVCVAIRGQSTKIPYPINGVGRLREALQTLAADALTDDGE